MKDPVRPTIRSVLSAISWHRLNQQCLIALLCFLSGWLYHAYGAPGGTLFRALDAFETYARQQWGYRPTEDLIPEQPIQTGIIYQDDQQTDGLILFSQTHTLSAQLIDKQGHLQHKWTLNPHDLEHCTTCFDLSYLRSLKLLPNGDLIALLINNNHTPWGGPLIKMTKDSKVLWVFDQHCHHDFTSNPEGHLFVLTHRFTHHTRHPQDPLNTLSINYAYDLPYLDDRIAILNANGTLIKDFSILSALAHSPFAHLGAALHDQGRRMENAITRFDPLHPNSIQYITPALASTHDYLQPGDLLVNLKHLNTILIIDPKHETVRHTITGPWHLAHHAQLLPNGHLSLFDNRSHWPHSRTLVFDMDSKRTLWQFNHDPQHPNIAPLASSDRSGQQQLDNGHFLITESRGGRIMEIDAQQHLHWVYQNPTVLELDTQRYRPLLGRAQFFNMHTLPFLTTRRPS